MTFGFFTAVPAVFKHCASYVFAFVTKHLRRAHVSVAHCLVLSPLHCDDRSKKVKNGKKKVKKGWEKVEKSEKKVKKRKDKKVEKGEKVKKGKGERVEKE